MKPGRGFTLIELLVVVAIIGILAALTLQVAGYVQRKGATSRAQAEIAALGAALESYKADNGIYPSAGPTDALRVTSGDNDMKTASAYFAALIAGPAVLPKGEASEDLERYKIYFSPNESMLSPNTTNSAISIILPKLDNPSENFIVNVRYFVDPFGIPYGYSSEGEKNGSQFFDLWSKSGTTGTSVSDQERWEKNW